MVKLDTACEAGATGHRDTEAEVFPGILCDSVSASP
jgi:hypothetical protein